jgi:hypothetical protein
MRRRTLLSWPLAGALALSISARAQENPLNISATVYSGFYTTSTKGQANQSLTFVPLGARFDIEGFLLSPDLLWYSFQPELALGPQASDAGIQGGDGVRLRVGLLRKRAFPITFRYSNVQVQDVYFGSLSQISGYRLQNRNKDLGVTFELKPSREMNLIFDWGKSSVDSKSDVQQVPDYLSSQNHINLDAKYMRAGWDFQAFGHHQTQESNLLIPIQGAGPAGLLKQTVDQAQASARRGFLKDSELYLDGGIQSTATMLFTLPIDLTTRYGTVNLRMFQRRRWKTSFRAAYSSNISSQLLAQAAQTLTTPGAAVPGETVLLPFSHGMSSLNVNGTTSAALAYGFGVYGSVERNEILASDQGAPLSSSYFMATAGVNYSKKFDWGTLGGQYGRELGYGSVTGQAGTIEGQLYHLSAIHTTGNGITFEASVHGANQSVNSIQPLSNDSLSFDGSVGFRAIGEINARFGGGWQQSVFVNSGNDFRTNGYTARVSMDHPRYQFTFALNDSLSNSLPLYSQLLGLGPGSVALLPLQIIPSDYHAMSFSFHATPLRKLEVSASWTHSIQHLDGVLSNNFELLNALVTYHFRKLQVEGGYIRFSQVFSLYPSLNRSRLYVRIQRTARIR